MRAKAYAKINLCLDVFSKKEELHELNSVMAKINLYDEIVFDKNKDVMVNTPFKDDIVIKAVEKLMFLFNIEEGVRIEVLKSIPTEAGLAGGSSDAATALLALNDLWKLNLAREDLSEIGTELGSDVAFFLGGNTCFVSGVGDKVKSLGGVEMNIVLVKPDYSISTRDAYDELDNKKFECKKTSLKLKEALSRRDIKEISSLLHNDFIYIQKEDVLNLIKEMKELGAMNASITGKGPTVFGIFENEDKAKEVYEKLKGKYKFAYLGKTIK